MPQSPPQPSNAAQTLAGLERWIGCVVLLTFAAVGYGVHHLFPFYAFDMFTRGDSTQSERIAARLADGSLVEVKRLRNWHCPTLAAVGLPPVPSDSSAKCQVRDLMDSQDRRAIGLIRQHAAASAVGQRVEVVRRVWRMPTAQRPGELFNCPLLDCTADIQGGLP
ncbi:MAG: hypothetical protein EXR77_18745 [Myxococcales bacterium]|nr:hypothetical protein [Myxococcales bacterium]